MIISWASCLVIPSSSPSSSCSASASKSSMLKVLGVDVELRGKVGGEASRDENITSGSLISSILRAIPGGDQSGLVQKSSSRVLLRAAFHLWIFHNSPLSVKSCMALRIARSSSWTPEGGDAPHVLAAAHTFCLYSKQQ